MKHFLRSCLATLASFFCIANLSAQSTCLIDSTITYDENDNPVYKTEYSYDAQGRINGTTTYRWENNVLIGDSKTFTVFDGSGRHITDVNYLWDATRNRWIGADSTVTIYTGSNITEKTIYAWDTATDNWIGQTRYTYTYFNNNANKKTLELEEHWSTSANNWEGYLQTTRTYNTAGNLKEEKANQSYNTATAQWYGGTRKVYNYNGNTTTKLLDEAYTWDAGHNGGAWKGSAKTTWTFNASNKQTNKTTYTWNTTTWNWQYSKKDDTSYDSANRTLETASYYYTNGDWAKTGSKVTYEYNAAGKILNKTTYTAKNNAWLESAKEVTAYDDAGNITENATKYTWDTDRWKGSGTRTVMSYNSSKKILDKYTYQWSNNEWTFSTWEVTRYDAAGNTNETAKYNWKNGAWEGTGNRVLTTYNSAKQKTEIIYYLWKNGDWQIVQQTNNTYSAGKLASDVVITWANGIYNQKTEKTYNAAGTKAIQTIVSNWTDGDWLYSTKTTTSSTEDNTYTWDSSITDWKLSSQTVYYSWGKITSKLINDVWTRYSGDSAFNGVVGGVSISARYVWSTAAGDWIGNTKTEQTYNSSNQPILYFAYTWEANDWLYTDKSEFEYDEQGNNTLVARYKYSNGEWVPNAKYEYGYDLAGHQTLDSRYNSVDGHWNGVYRTEYSYQGDLTSEIVDYSWTGDLTWKYSTKLSYTYDDQNRVITTATASYINNAWENQQKTEVEYNSANVKVKDNKYVWLNDDWAYSTRSEQIYDDDAEGKLREELTASYTDGVVESFSRVVYFYHNDPHYIYQTEEDDICDEALPYTWHGKQLNEAGQLIDTVPGTDIFDTIITFTLTVNYRTYGSEEDTIKDSQLPYIWHNKQLNEAGEIKDTLINVANCDSIITFTLTVLPTTTGTDGDVICDNNLPYTWREKTLTESCQVKDTIPNALGGDSIITFTLTVNNRTYGSEEATIKDSQLPYIWHEKTLTETCEIKDTLTNVAGCDSIVTFTLTVLPTTTGTDGDIICDNTLPYIWHEKTLTESCQVIDTIPNTLGGDSIITFTLTVNYRTYGTEETTIKDSQLPYVWNNMELTEGGEHPYTTTNVAGCDSTVTLTLTILPTTYGTEEATIYSNKLPYVWHNKTLYAAGEVKDTLVNAAQGDSIITFTLTVINLVKAHKNIPMQIVCPGTVIGGRTSSKTITAYTQWIDSVRIEYSPTNLVDSFYHYSAMPYSLSAPDMDESQLNPVCRDYLNLDALKDQVLGYINADALYAPLIEPVTSALEWQIRYDSEEWRGWLNLPVSDTNSILSLRVIIHTDCGDAITEPIEAQIQCQPTALDELYEPFNPDAPAYNLLGQPVSPDYHGVVIQSGHKYIR